MTRQPVDINNIVDRIKPILAGRQPEIQGAVLADLLATWLAGHIIPGDPDRTTAMREEMLKFHIDAVRKLIPVNEAEIREMLERQRC